MIALASDPELSPEHLPTDIRNALEASAAAGPRPAVETSGVASMAEIERIQIQRALKIARGDCSRAAKLLGIGRTTLYRKLKRYAAAGSATA